MIDLIFYEKIKISYKYLKNKKLTETLIYLETLI